MAASLNVVVTAFAFVFLPTCYAYTVRYDTTPLSKTITDISKQLMQLKSKNCEIRREYDALKQDTSKKIAEISNVNRKLQTENSALRVDVDNLKELVNELRLALARDPTEPRKLKSVSGTNRKRLLIPPAAGNHTDQPGVAVAAFSAHLHGDLTIGPNQDVVYTSVITNIGRCYDRRYGYFVAPVHGVYLFTASICTEPSVGVHLSMVKNGVDVAIIYSDYKGWDLSSQTIVLVLEKGEVVWMKHDDITDRRGNATLKGGYTTFSGVLVNVLP